MATLSAWGRIVKKAFKSNQRIKGGRPRTVIKTTTGTPNAEVTGVVGLLCWNSFDLDAYICTATPTTWVKLNA